MFIQAAGLVRGFIDVVQRVLIIQNNTLLFHYVCSFYQVVFEFYNETFRLSVTLDGCRRTVSFSILFQLHKVDIVIFPVFEM